MLFNVQGQCYEVLSGPYGAVYNVVRDAGDKSAIKEQSSLIVSFGAKVKF
jgi:hypothetical protein